MNKNKMTMAERVVPWFAVNGDKTHRLNYNLNSESIVFDIGGYEGNWANDIFEKYNCNICIFEPVQAFYNVIKNKYAKENKIKAYQFGLSDKNTEVLISISRDSSSIYADSDKKEEIRLVDVIEFLDNNEIEVIDLMKINIEGGEYDLLPCLISSKYIKKIRNIQVQFHDFLPNAEKIMNEIQYNLSKTHKLTYQYEFVWENWELKK